MFVERCHITPYSLVVVSTPIPILSVFFLSLSQLPEPPRIRLTLCLSFIDRECVTAAYTLSHPLPLALVTQTLVSQHILPLLTTKMYLQKRDGNMGFDIAPALIIFLVILGAGALVCCGFAVARFMGGEPEDESSRFHRSPEQDSYMREVRERSWRKLPQLGMPKPYYQSHGGNMAHAPMSPR